MIERAELPVHRNSVLKGPSLMGQPLQQAAAVGFAGAACGAQQDFSWAICAPSLTLTP